MGKHSKKYYAFLLVYLCIGTYVFANVLDLQFWPLSYINPPERAEPLYRTLDYPYHSLFSFQGSLIVEVQIALVTDAPLAEEVPATISAIGGLNGSSADVSYVFVGFIGSSPYSPIANVLMVGYQFPYIELQRNGTIQYGFAGGGVGFLITGKPQVIVWHSQGDYAPVLVIWFRNSTTITETFPSLTVHVNSADVARSERYNRVNQALSVALVAFGFVEGYKILHEIDETKKNQSSDAAIEPLTTRKPSNKAKPTK